MQRRCMPSNHRLNSAERTGLACIAHGLLAFRAKRPGGGGVGCRGEGDAACDRERTGSPRGAKRP